MNGNVVDLAVGVIIGAAFSKIIDSPYVIVLRLAAVLNSSVLLVEILR
jgi:large-conductance mechanosensitive channel